MAEASTSATIAHRIPPHAFFVVSALFHYLGPSFAVLLFAAVEPLGVRKPCALHRLEHQGWITAEWGASENNRRARFYALTKPGRKQLEAEVAKWERLSAGVNLVLRRT